MKFASLEPQRCEDTKGIVAPEVGLKSWKTFEKLAADYNNRQMPTKFCAQKAISETEWLVLESQSIETF